MSYHVSADTVANESDMAELYSGCRGPVIPIHSHSPLVLCNAVALKPIYVWYPFCRTQISDVGVIVGTCQLGSSVASAEAEQSVISWQIAKLPVYPISHVLGILASTIPGMDELLPHQPPPSPSNRTQSSPGLGISALALVDNPPSISSPSSSKAAGPCEHTSLFAFHSF